MKIIRCLSLLLLMLGVASLSKANTNESSIAYNWAKSGLNIRETPWQTAKVIGAIPFGEAVEILEVTAEYTSIEVRGLFSKEFSKDGNSYYVDGSWVKVKYEEIVGYAFDGYLSEFPPMRIIEIDEANAYPEGFESYLRRISTPVDSSSFAKQNSEYWHKKIRFANGGIYERSGSVGWYEEVFILPEASLKIGFLFFQLAYDNEQMRTLSGREQLRIIKQSPLLLKFWIGGPSGEYEIYQFGSTLVIRISDSC
ncbi:MAG: SH3 domain-containing protein [Bacteroidota bacterium]